MRKSKDKTKNQGSGAIPKVVVNRLSLYLRELQILVRDGVITTSSTKLGELLGVTDAQVRKDLANFGQFGYPGVGYRCDELIAAIKRIMGTDQHWPVALIGVGNLGRALLGYRGFGAQGFEIVAAFDSDTSVIGTSVEGMVIQDFAHFPASVSQREIRLAIIAVPPSAAQEVADTIAAAGVKGILNFAPVTLKLPSSVTLVAVDLAIEMEQLSFAMTRRIAEGLLLD
ncbi:MAG: redox-sensing transcriptional repressor Rex, partial [Pirellulaceae bacterium]